MISVFKMRSFIKLHRVFVIVMLIIFTLACGCSTKKLESSTVELTVSSPPSLKGSLEEIKSIYAVKNPNIKLIYNYGSSGSLQRQIEQGAPTDIFISQGKKQMDELEQGGFILKETRIDLLSDKLVLIAAKNNTSINSFEDLLKPDIIKIGIGDPDTVPAAKTTKETLETLKLWDKLQPKLVMGKDLLQVMSYVETGNAEAGFVWDTIALTSDKVKVVSVASEDLHKPVFLPAGVVASASNRIEADKFLNYLQNEQAIKIFEKNGFQRVSAKK